MKKEIFGFILMFLIIISLLAIAIAQNDDNAGLGNEAEGIEGIKNIDITSKTDEVLEKEIKIPESLQIPARIIFGIKQGEEIPFRIFIVLIAVWFMLFLIIVNTLKIMPLFGSGFKSWLGGLVVTCLISITGTTLGIANFFFELGNFFGILEKYKILGVIAALVIVGVIIFVISKILKTIRNKVTLESAETAGTEAGAGVRLGRTYYEESTKK